MKFPAGKRIVLTAALVAAAFRPVQTEERFTATLGGDEVQPPVSTSAKGTTTFKLLGDTAVQYDLQVSQLKDPWTASLYSAAGLRVVTLFVGPRYGEVNGVLAQGTFTDRDVLFGLTLKELVELMRNGQAYVEIRTAGHSAGEIRGRITKVGGPVGTNE